MSRNRSLAALGAMTSPAPPNPARARATDNTSRLARYRVLLELITAGRATLARLALEDDQRRSTS